MASSSHFVTLNLVKVGLHLGGASRPRLGTVGSGAAVTAEDISGVRKSDRLVPVGVDSTVGVGAAFSRRRPASTADLLGGDLYKRLT